MTSEVPTAAGRVLSTMNEDGSRRWLRPRPSPGRFLIGRRVVGYGLIALFTGLPWIRIGGEPAMLFDLPNRRFVFFGTTFLPTDTLLLALLILGIFLTIFLVTAMFGRVWCGWGCPQTVYMELVYRPLQRLFEGRAYRTGGRTAPSAARSVGKYAAYAVVSLVLAHTFLAYFIGTDALFDWMRSSPLEHPTAFAIMAGTTILMMLDFAYMREQVCTLMCPYGRFQSVLLDRQSLTIGYDGRRGEPRGKRRKGGSTDDLGDCIDCRLCVDTCPTGIDIRDGLQMECVGCAQCIDACDAVMDRVGSPRGLIRYGSQEQLETGRRRLLRPRVVAYPALLVVVFGLFGWTLASRGTADVSFLRTRNATYRMVPGGQVANVLELKLVNRSDGARRYTVTVLEDAAGLEESLALGPGATGQLTLHVVLPRDRFERGRAEVTVRVAGDDGFDRSYEQRVLGPLFGGGAP